MGAGTMCTKCAQGRRRRGPSGETAQNKVGRAPPANRGDGNDVCGPTQGRHVAYTRETPDPACWLGRHGAEGPPVAGETVSAHRASHGGQDRAAGISGHPALPAAALCAVTRTWALLGPCPLLSLLPAIWSKLPRRGYTPSEPQTPGAPAAEAAARGSRWAPHRPGEVRPRGAEPQKLCGAGDAGAPLRNRVHPRFSKSKLSTTGHIDMFQQSHNKSHSERSGKTRHASENTATHETGPDGPSERGELLPVVAGGRPSEGLRAQTSGTRGNAHKPRTRESHTPRGLGPVTAKQRVPA